MHLYCNIVSLEPSLITWNKLYQKELSRCTEMVKGSDFKVNVCAQFCIPQSLMYMEPNIHLERSACHNELGASIS